MAIVAIVSCPSLAIDTNPKACGRLPRLKVSPIALALGCFGLPEGPPQKALYKPSETPKPQVRNPIFLLRNLGPLSGAVQVPPGPAEARRPMAGCPKQKRPLHFDFDNQSLGSLGFRVSLNEVRSGRAV